MNNGEFEQPTDSSATSDSEAPAIPQRYEVEADDAIVNSKLDQQVEAAIREVEDLLVTNGQTGSSSRHSERSEIDWSIPNLVEPETKPDGYKTEDHTHDLSEPPFEVAPASPEEAEIRECLRAVERQITEVAEVRQQTENRLLIKLEAEAALQADASARRREEEELRRQTEEAAAERRHEDELRLKAQHDLVNETESELKRIWTEERRLRSEVVRLNQTVHELLQRRARAEEDAKLALLAEAQRARDEAEEVHLESLARLHSEEEALRRTVARFGLRRTELEFERQKHEVETRALEEEKVRLSVAIAASVSERTRIRSEAEERLRLDEEQLSAQENELSRLTEGLSQRRAELELARQRAEEDSRRLAEARARMQAAEEFSQQAERERLALEAEILNRAEVERHMLEDARSRAEEQQRRLEASERDRGERESRRVAELEALRIAGEANVQIYFEKEQRLKSELESIRLSSQATLERIEEFETHRQTAVDTYSRMIERLKRVEEEAHARATEEGQARTDLERRIKEETDHLRRLESEHSQRIGDEISRRIEAEKRLQETKDRYQAEQAARIKAELQFDLWDKPESTTLREVEAKANDPVDSPAEVEIVSADALSPSRVREDKQFQNDPIPDQPDTSAVPVYQVGNLSSADPRLRADAVTALARLGTQDSYALIVNCFDDESILVRNAAARAVLTLEPERPVESFTRALKDASPERSKRIGKAISESGLAAQAVKALCGEDREETYNGLCLLFTMAKTGEVEPLVQAIEHHDDAEVRLAAIRLLKLSGQEELASAAVQRRLRTNKDH